MCRQYQIKIFLSYIFLFYIGFFETLIAADNINCSEIFNLEFDDLNRIKSARIEFSREKQEALNESYLEVWFAFNELPLNVGYF